VDETQKEGMAAYEVFAAKTRKAAVQNLVDRGRWQETGDGKVQMTFSLSARGQYDVAKEMHTILARFIDVARKALGNDEVSLHEHLTMETEPPKDVATITATPQLLDAYEELARGHHYVLGLDDAAPHTTMPIRVDGKRIPSAQPVVSRI